MGSVNPNTRLAEHTAMDRRKVLTGIAAVTTGVTAIPAVPLASSLEGQTIADLMEVRDVAAGHADHVESLWRVSQREFAKAKPRQPRKGGAKAKREWETECERARVSTGFAAIEQADREAIDALLEIEDAILNAPVTCLADAHSKLTVLTSRKGYRDQCWNECLEVVIQQIADAA